MNGIVIYLSRNSIIYYAMIVMFFSCSYSDKKIINLFERKFPKYDLSNFKITEKYQLGYFQYNLCNSDTTKTLSFAFFPDSNKNKEIIFLSYMERRLFHDSTLVTGFDDNKEVVFSFYHDSKWFVADENAKFLNGQYYYLYNYHNSTLNPHQIDYYEANKDSIIENRLNLLPIH